MLISLALGVLGASPLSGDTPRCSFLEDPGHVLPEWGTFTTLAGSDGGLLEGFALPLVMRLLAEEGRERDHVREPAELLEQSF